MGVRQGAGNGKGKRVMAVLNRPPAHDVKEEVQQGKYTWLPPPAGWAKLNVDGVFSADTGQASTGVVVRDSQADVYQLGE